MSGQWEGSRRSESVPHNWTSIRQLVMERDNGRCQEFMRDGTQCTDPGTECDHIINVASGGTHSLDNLRMLCKWHHGKKSSAEGNAARKSITEQKPRERHPGLIL